MDVLNKFEKCIYSILIGILALLIILSMLDLAWLIIDSLFSPPVLLLENRELLDIFGFVLLVLIGLELLDTIKAYLKENIIHFEIVILLAIVAIARKVILIDPNVASYTEFIGIGVVVIGLAGGYYLIKKAGISTSGTEQQEPPV